MKGNLPMKTGKRLILFILLFFTPIAAIAEEIITDVIVVVEADKIVAYSGQGRNWVPHRLKLKEKVYQKQAHGNVAVVITNARLYGFSATIGKWNLIELLLNEEIKDLQVEGNVATVTTDQRICGFNAHTGDWSEFK
jgi:hypothetical protein